MSKLPNFLEKLIKPFMGREKKKSPKEDADLKAMADKEQKVFRYEALAAATRDFSANNRLGEGGFGPVYKGRLKDGRDVAVKRLGRGSRQGAREFENEALLLSKVQHKNIVKLYGYCTHGDDDKILVYEYVSNKSLDKLLFPPPPPPASTSEENGGMQGPLELDWKRRYGVMMGVARGLLYLHEDTHTAIIHRDIKPSNILIDERWTPKIADFGMARLFTEDFTHINTRVAGTNGYMAPEYVMHGILSTKADVYSFGVLILELVSGIKNSMFTPLPEAKSLLEWTWKLYKKGQSLEIMDPTLRSTAVTEQVAVCVHLGLLCIQSNPKLRPDMRRVLVILSKKPGTLEDPIQPGIPGSRYRKRSLTPRDSSYSGKSTYSTLSASSYASLSGSSYANSVSNGNNTDTTVTTSSSTSCTTAKNTSLGYVPSRR